MDSKSIDQIGIVQDASIPITRPRVEHRPSGCLKQFDYDYVSNLFLQYRKSKACGDHPTEAPKLQDRVVDDSSDCVWEPIRSVLAQHTVELSTGTESVLVKRMAQANTRRRRQWAYWRHHRDKLARHAEAALQPIEGNIDKGISPPLLPAFHVPGNHGATPRATAANSVTTVSRLVIPQLTVWDNQSSVSISEYAASTWQPGKEVLKFPTPPKHEAGQKFFECPYCFTLCSTAQLFKHIAQHLERIALFSLPRSVMDDDGNDDLDLPASDKQNVSSGSSRDGDVNGSLIFHDDGSPAVTEDEHLENADVRESSYYHSCSNEWYTNEHDLQCPRCTSQTYQIVRPLQSTNPGITSQSC